MQKLRQRLDHLERQHGRLPTRTLRRTEDLDARLITLAAQRARVTERVRELPEPRRRLGQEHDPEAVERAQLGSVLEAGEHELKRVLKERDRLVREVGDPGEIHAERDGLERAIAELTREHTTLVEEVAEREVWVPSPWAQAAFGEPPDR